MEIIVVPSVVKPFSTTRYIKFEQRARHKVVLVANDRAMKVIENILLVILSHKSFKRMFGTEASVETIKMMKVIFPYICCRYDRYKYDNSN